MVRASAGAASGSAASVEDSFEHGVVVLGYFDWQRKEYAEIPVHEQVEVATLAGDIALSDHEPEVYAHPVVGDSSGNARAGHLLNGHVRPTLELILTETPATLRKVVDHETGLALIATER